MALGVVLGLLVTALSVFVVPLSRFLRGAPADTPLLLVTVVGAVICLAVLGAVAGTLVLTAG